jgi:dUTP pyrophosphatase
MRKYFEEQEKVWLIKEGTKGKITKLNIPEREVVIEYFDQGKKVQVVKKFWEINKLRKKDEVYFAKVKPDAKIPSKRYEDGCYDVYACFEEDFIEIKPGEIKLVPTGIASAFSPKYRFYLRERGSTGVKGMARRAGVIDSGYRNEWIVPINNTTNESIVIAKESWTKTHVVDSNTTFYPYEKAVAQAALEFVPNVFIKELPYEELKAIPSIRGMGRLGDSGK